MSGRAEDDAVADVMFDRPTQPVAEDTSMPVGLVRRVGAGSGRMTSRATNGGPMGDDADETNQFLTLAENAARKAIETEVWIHGGGPIFGTGSAAMAVLNALRALPVEQRMKAMGMVAWDTVHDYDGNDVTAWTEPFNV